MVLGLVPVTRDPEGIPRLCGVGICAREAPLGTGITGSPSALESVGRVNSGLFSEGLCCSLLGDASRTGVETLPPENEEMEGSYHW